MRKKLFYLAGLMILLSIPVLYSQSAESIIDKYLNALGGLSNLRAWKSMKVTGKYISMIPDHIEVPMTVWYKSPNKKKTELLIQNKTAIYAFDGEMSWFCDPSRGFSEPTLMPEEQAVNNRNHADEYPFVDFEKKGHQIEYLGKEIFEGRDVHKIKLTRDTGSESFHFFDVKTGHEVRILINLKRGDKTIIYETIERNFRKFDWLTLPWSIETRVNGKATRRIEIESLELDPILEDSFFRMPSKNAQNK